MQDAVAMRPLDCLVDCLRQAEIVGGEDDALHGHAVTPNKPRREFGSLDRRRDRALGGIT